MSEKYPLFKIEVKKWLTHKGDKNPNPMPLMVMEAYVKADNRGRTETEKGIHIKARGQIFSERTICCCKCGIPLTNDVSTYFGIGPVCGHHNYINPFNTRAELKAAVADIRTKLNETVWEGWVAKSNITAITPLEDYPLNITINGKKI